MTLELINGILQLGEEETAELKNNNYTIKNENGTPYLIIAATAVLSDGTGSWKRYQFENGARITRGFSGAEMAAAVKEYGKLLTVTPAEESGNGRD